MDALNYLGYDPNKELPIVAKIKSDVKKLNDKNLIISKIKEMEAKLNFEYEKQRLIWNEKEDSDPKSAKNNQPSRPPEMFEPIKFKLNIDMNSNTDEYMEKISEFLEEKNCDIERSESLLSVRITILLISPKMTISTVEINYKINNFEKTSKSLT